MQHANVKLTCLECDDNLTTEGHCLNECCQHPHPTITTDEDLQRQINTVRERLQYIGGHDAFSVQVFDQLLLTCARRDDPDAIRRHLAKFRTPGHLHQPLFNSAD